MDHIDWFPGSIHWKKDKETKTGLFITQILYLLSLSSSNMTFSLFSNRALSFLFCEATTICIESNINVWQHLVDALKKPHCPTTAKDEKKNVLVNKKYLIILVKDWSNLFWPI